ncbi:hypothetical protein IGI04_002255 [Brassica rapa subsp. trilocularis]|uniref:Ig-like domain-containing protein n=1 Tax=Brassica rapa subsp. trilocularis TaxID=1813537 RepID=A0ABQ7NV53_BRACM|nr:hypothetical protein IGI04_002255 [Brassica rapa subsp. trilocularis]
MCCVADSSSVETHLQSSLSQSRTSRSSLSRSTHLEALPSISQASSVSHSLMYLQFRCLMGRRLSQALCLELFSEVFTSITLSKLRPSLTVPVPLQLAQTVPVPLQLSLLHSGSGSVISSSLSTAVPHFLRWQKRLGLLKKLGIFSNSMRKREEKEIE